MNNQSVSLVATTNIKQDWQKIWQPTVGEVLVHMWLNIGGLHFFSAVRLPVNLVNMVNQHIACHTIVVLDAIQQL